MFAMHVYSYLVLGLLGLGRPAWAEDIAYITDLPIFSMLVPCAQTAVSTQIATMTVSKCSDGATELQSCICSNYYSTVALAIASSVTHECALTATEDQASAATVYSAYCNQDTTYTFPEPAVSVTDFIDDIVEYSYLAPCVSSEVSYVANSMTYNDCPPDAAHLATCMCQKQQNSLMISQLINTNVRTACSSMTADLSSAQAFFAAYCNMLNGTSSFPTASSPPGDMSYYITDMPQFSSLSSCAATALSYGVFSNTYNLCPSGPQMLASCACIKDRMSARISDIVASSVREACSSPAAALTAALDIFATYCSAAANELVVTGITTSVSQTAPSGVSTTSLPKATSTTTSRSSSSSSSGSGSTSGSKSDSDSDSDSTSTSSSSSKTPIIVGVVVGVVGGLCLITAAAYFVFRHVRKQKNASVPPHEGDYPLTGKPELGGAAVAGPDSTTQMYPSNVSAAHEMYSPVSNGYELSGQGLPPQADSRPVPLHSYAELDGHQIARP